MSIILRSGTPSNSTRRLYFDASVNIGTRWLLDVKNTKTWASPDIQVEAGQTFKSLDVGLKTATAAGATFGDNTVAGDGIIFTHRGDEVIEIGQAGDVDLGQEGVTSFIHVMWVGKKAGDSSEALHILASASDDGENDAQWYLSAGSDGGTNPQFRVHDENGISTAISSSSPDFVEDEIVQIAHHWESTGTGCVLKRYTNGVLTNEVTSATNGVLREGATGIITSIGGGTSFLNTGFNFFRGFLEVLESTNSDSSGGSASDVITSDWETNRNRFTLG